MRTPWAAGHRVALFACLLLALCNARWVRAEADLIAHWTFDEGSGTTCADSSGNGHTGTLQNGAAWTTGIVGSGALYFDGVDDYVSLGMANQPVPWTLAFWLKRQPVTGDSAYLMQGTNCSLRTEQYSNTKKLGFTQNSVGDYTFNYEAPVDQWIHVAYVTTAGGTVLFVNGLQVDSRSEKIDLPLTSISYAAVPMKGALDDMYVYSRALSQAEIQGLIPQLPPQVGNDSYNAAKDTPLTVNAAQGVLANDYDVNGDPFTAVKQTDPAHGSVTLNAEGSFTYTPAPGFAGSDSFTYVANDGANSEPATVVITITTLWHLTIPLAGSYHVPSGEVYLPVVQAARFADASATINYMETTYTDDDGGGGRDYDCAGMIHTSASMQHDTSYSGRAGAGQIGRNTSYPPVMTFYARKNFDTGVYEMSTPGQASFEITGRYTLTFGAGGMLYAGLWLHRGDGHSGPDVRDIRLLANITCQRMPGAALQALTPQGNAIGVNWRVSPAQEAVAQKLYRATDPGGAWTVLQSFSDNTTNAYADSNVQADTGYHYKVVAEEAGGVAGSESNVLSGNPSDLVARWKFDEGSGTTAGDSSGNGNTGTLVNGPAWTTGIISGAVSFDGTDDFVSVADNLLRDNLSLTLAMWIRTTASGILFAYQNAAYPSSSTNGVPALYVGTDGKLRGEFWMGAVSPIASALSVSDGRWHHVAVTGNTNTQTLYLDGQPAGTLSGQINHLDMSKNQVGTGWGGWPGLGSGWQFFRGSIDDVRIYSRALTQAEIQALIRQMPPVAADDSYWGRAAMALR